MYVMLVFIYMCTILTIKSADYETTLNKLSNAEVQIEDLKLQLDDALGAEEMLVQLTERNLHLGEVCILHRSSRDHKLMSALEN